jgi:hypothetical protein
MPARGSLVDTVMGCQRPGKGTCQRKAEVAPSVRNRDVLLWFRERV